MKKIIGVLLSLIILSSFQIFGRHQHTLCSEVQVIHHEQPSFEKPVSQLATENQFHSPQFHDWCHALHEEWHLHRKLWEYCYVLQVLHNNQMLSPGKAALGFGVGKEPLPALLAQHGVSVVASDQDFQSACDQGWASSKQYAVEKESLNSRQICDPQLFHSLVELTTVDMNHIPESLHNKFDVVWSCCSLEHLGSIEAGLTFIKNSVKCLKPGGIAVHTTEFNLSSNLHTITQGGTVLFRQLDILKVACELSAQGYEVIPLNFHPGQGALDTYIDLPPYQSEPHLKLLIGNYTCTSIGLIIRK